MRKSTFLLTIAVILVAILFWQRNPTPPIKASTTSTETASPLTLRETPPVSNHACQDSCSHGTSITQFRQRFLKQARRSLEVAPQWQNLAGGSGQHAAIAAAEAGLADWPGQTEAAFRARAIRPTALLISGSPIEPGVRFSLPLFDDANFTAVVKRSLVNANGTVSTLAHLEHSPWGRAAIAYTDGELRIKVLDPDSHRQYPVHYNHTDGMHYALELDPAIVRERRERLPRRNPPPILPQEKRPSPPAARTSQQPWSTSWLSTPTTSSPPPVP
jgi:hypothetical protein